MVLEKSFLFLGTRLVRSIFTLVDLRQRPYTPDRRAAHGRLAVRAAGWARSMVPLEVASAYTQKTDTVVLRFVILFAR